MRKAIIAAIVVLSLFCVAGVAYRMGWFARFAAGPRGSSGIGGSGQAATQAAPGQQASGQQPVAGGAEGGVPGDGFIREPIPAPKFTGNLASVDFGATVERTSENYADRPDHSQIIDGDPETAWRNGGSSESIGELVLSFFAREVALVDGITLHCSSEEIVQCPRDVEVWVSTAASPDGPFVKVAAASLPKQADPSLPFAPVEARFLKLRLLKNHETGPEARLAFWVNDLEVHEAQRSGYVPLLSRHSELARSGGPVALPAGLPVPTAVNPPCVPAPSSASTAALPPSAHPESSHVLVVAKGEYMVDRLLERLGEGRSDLGLSEDELALVKRVRLSKVVPGAARPALLAPALGVDTVVLAQVCDIKESVPAAFKQALDAWVAAGHKLIIQDSDDCSAPGPDYSFLPYKFHADVPGALGAEGSDLRFIESNNMLHGRAGRPGFLDVKAWSAGAPPYANELGDASTFTGWDGNWCGALAVRNAHGVFGFTVAYAHYGRGLIIYEGLDNDQGGLPGYDTVLVRELAQPFDPDNLPCGAHLGDFVVTTDSWLFERAAVPGRSYSYPLTLLSNQGYKGTVNLAASSSPGLQGLNARFEPASVTLDGEGKSTLTVTLPPGAAPPPTAIEVKGTDAAGKVNTLCLQLGPPKTGELTVVSALAPAAKASKNLEIILDASGSMKTPLGKKTRWSVALDTLQQVLAKLPDDFNVGLRMYGHREGSRSPRTCTDSELIAPIVQIDRASILDKAKAFKPKGETPLVYSALQAPADLKEVGGGTVILITDGEESCKGDAMKAAATLKSSGLDLRLNIVGFGLANAKAQKDLAGFAQATGGLFYSAQSGDALAEALLVAAIDSFPFTVHDGTGKVVTSGEAGAPAEQLPPGDYKVVVKAGGRELTKNVHVALGGTTRVTIALQGGQLVL